MNGSSLVTVVFRKLARSDRLAVAMASILVLAGSMLVLLVDRAVELAQSNIALQFRELEGAFNEQERFLLGWKLHDADAAELLPVATPTNAPLGWALVGPRTAEATSDPARLASGFIDFYRDFWAQSRYRPSQCLLVNGRGTQGVLAPAKYGPQYQMRGVPTQLRSALERVRQAVASRPRLRAGHVGWAEEPWIDGQVRYVAVASAPEDAVHWGESGTSAVPSIACLMETNGLLADLQSSAASDFSKLSIFTPAGTRLIGDSQVSREGPAKRFGLHGLELRMQGRGGWTAVYTISLQDLLLDNPGTLLAGTLLSVMVALAGTMLLRNRRREIIQELQIREDRLLESQEFSRAVLDSAPVGICLLRRRDGAVMLDNVRVRRFLGGDHDHGGWQGAWRQDVQDSLGEDVIAYTTPDGRHLQVSTAPVRFDGEDALLCLFVDATLQQNTEQALRAAQQASESANVAKSQFLAMISHEIRTPLYGVLGTLELLGLTTLDSRQRGYLRTVESSSSTLMHLIDDILDISKAEAGELELVAGTFDPAALTEDTVAAWTGAAQRKGLNFHGVIDAKAPALVNGDAARIRQVLNNLLSNAIKFTEHGRVTLRLFVRHDGDACLLCWQVSDSGMGISASDQARLFERFYQVHAGNDSRQGTGLGLAICDQLARMMGGRIAVTSQVGLGSSFALEIPAETDTVGGTAPETREGLVDQAVLLRGEPQEVVNSLLERLGQRGIKASLLGPHHAPSDGNPAVLLEVLLGHRATPGEWTGPHVVATGSAAEQPELIDGEWWVTAHRLDAMMDAVAAATGSATGVRALHAMQAVRQLGLTVLVAEDNPINQAIIRGQLEQLGCHPVIAANGSEALGYCRERPFSLLLTDLNMPVMDGYALTAAVRELGLDMPVVGTSANADPAERERCRGSGMTALLIKPISLKDLQAILLSAASPPARP